MDYEVSDSSGTDDDFPPSHQNQFQRGERVLENGRSGLGSAAYSRMYIDMEAQIHHLEQEAYIAVLRAFKAQSEAITWEKEGLITELRKELRVSDDKHRELLTKVTGEDIIQRIREWRLAGGPPAMRFNASQAVHDIVSSPTVPVSRKKQKTSVGYPSIAPAGNRYFSNRSSSVAPLATDPAELATQPLLGKRLWTRWPDDNNFYEAVITGYNEGRHSIVYDADSENPTVEWINLKEMSPADIRWEGEDPGIPYRGGHSNKKPTNRVGSVPSGRRGRESTKGVSEEFLQFTNGIRKVASDDIELLNTETLVEEVEKVCGVSHPDPIELQKAKKMLKDHEQALVDAIERLKDASDGESGNNDFRTLGLLVESRNSSMDKQWSSNEVKETFGALTRRAGMMRASARGS